MTGDRDEEEERYVLEWAIRAEELDEDERTEMMETVTAQFDGVDAGAPVVRQSAEPTLWLSVGTFVVTSVSTLIQVYEFLQNQGEDSTVPIIKVEQGSMVHTVEADEETVESVGGDVVGTVDEDVVLAKLDPFEAIELRKEEETEE